MTQNTTTLATIKTSELEEYFQNSIQSRIEADLCNYPSAHDPYTPAEESYEVKFIDEHFMLEDDYEDEANRFAGLAEVEFYQDNDEQQVKITLCGNVWACSHKTYKSAEFKQNGEAINWREIPEEGQTAFESIFNVTPAFFE